MSPRSPHFRLLVGLFAVAIPFAGCGLSTEGTADVAGNEVCTVDANCDDKDFCTTDTCSPDGLCSHAAVADGNAAQQAAGDCSTSTCKGGVETKLDDDKDKPDDGNSCTSDTCNMGVGSHTNLMPGHDCKLNGKAGHCEQDPKAGTVQCAIACGAMTAGCDDGNPCTHDECDLTNHKCVYMDLNGPPPSGPGPLGDCHVQVCVNGVDTDVVDDTDLPASPNDCLQNHCSGGNPLNPPVLSEAKCATKGGAVCDGAGNCVECVIPADCTGLPPNDECQTRTCSVTYKCGQTFTPDLTPLKAQGAQTADDCSLVVCDGAGKSKTVADPADHEDNNNCTTDSCNGTTPVHASLPAGTMCGANSVCDGQPANPLCVGCNVPSDCSTFPNDSDCKQTTCSAAHVCGTALPPNGMLTSTQTMGNCQDNVCDGNGLAVNVSDNNDKPVDGNPCTQDLCNNGVPSNPAIVCTALDQCHVVGTCSGGDCSNPSKGDGTGCIDGNACTLNDVCTAGVCGGSVMVCTALDQCHNAGVCNGGVCSNPIKNNTACTDGNACTTGDVCSAGMCVGGAAPNCDDSNVCTTDTCSMATGCVHANNALSCSDGNSCTTGDVCSAGMCVGGAGPNCDDSNVCTTDTCSMATGCVHANNAFSCSDANSCTTGDVCAGGTCSGTAIVCTAMDQCHTVGTCSGGTCSNPVKNCALYACSPATGCLMACTMDSDCIATAYCDNGGLCAAQKALGDPCSRTADCKVNGCRECGGASSQPDCTAGANQHCI